MVVLKFGGTSVADAQPIARAAAIVARQQGPRIVVVSALAGVTDRLLQAAALARAGRAPAARGVLDGIVQRHHSIAATFSNPPSPALTTFINSVFDEGVQLLEEAGAERRLERAALDRLLAVGELMSSRVATLALEAGGVAAAWVDPRRVIATTGDHSRAQVLLEATTANVAREVLPFVADGRVVVTGGFVGTGPDGATTTLGRGGSDVTAAALGVSARASEVQIWTDVDGVLTADPRLVRQAFTVAEMSFEGARDLAFFGAKVLHPGTLDVAARGPVAVRVLNSRNPAATGTRVTSAAAASRTPVTFACRRALHTVLVTPRSGNASSLLHSATTLVEPVVPAPILVETADGRLFAGFDDAMSAGDFAAALKDVGDIRMVRDTAALAVVNDASQPASDSAEVPAAIDDLHVYAIGRPPGGRTTLFVLDDVDLAGAMNRLHDASYPAPDAPTSGHAANGSETPSTGACS
jgi:aspartate kinase